MENQNKYNDEPVHFCKHCLSLDNPKTIDDSEYCDHCGSTEFEDAHISIWEKKFEKKYNQGKFLNINIKHKKGELWKTIMQSSNNPML